MQSGTRLPPLEQARDCARAYVDLWVERQLAEYSEATRLAKANQRGYLDAKAEQKKIQEQIAANAQAQAESESLRRQLHESQVALEAKRQGIGALKTKDELERSIADNSRALADKARPVHEQSQQLQRNVQATGQLLQQLAQTSLGVEIPALDSKALRQLGQKVVATEEQVDLDLGQLINRDWVGIEQLEEDVAQLKAAEVYHNQWADALHNPDLSDRGQSLRDQLAQRLGQADRRRQDINGKLRQKQKEVALLQARKISYPPYVEAALQAIGQALPQAQPCVLCDYVDILDANWQMAIEGYLGGARFAILVEPEYEAEAMRLVRAMPGGKRNKAPGDSGRESPPGCRALAAPGRLYSRCDGL